MFRRAFTIPWPLLGSEWGRRGWQHRQKEPSSLSRVITKPECFLHNNHKVHSVNVFFFSANRDSYVCQYKNSLTVYTPTFFSGCQQPIILIKAFEAKWQRHSFKSIKSELQEFVVIIINFIIIIITYIVMFKFHSTCACFLYWIGKSTRRSTASLLSLAD